MNATSVKKIGAMNSEYISALMRDKCLASHSNLAPQYQNYFNFIHSQDALYKPLRYVDAQMMLN